MGIIRILLLVSSLIFLLDHLPRVASSSKGSSKNSRNSRGIVFSSRKQAFDILTDKGYSKEHISKLIKNKEILIKKSQQAPAVIGSSSRSSQQRRGSQPVHSSVLEMSHSHSKEGYNPSQASQTMKHPFVPSSSSEESAGGPESSYEHVQQRPVGQQVFSSAHEAVYVLKKQGFNRHQIKEMFAKRQIPIGNSEQPAGGAGPSSGHSQQRQGGRPVHSSIPGTSFPHWGEEYSSSQANQMMGHPLVHSSNSGEYADVAAFTSGSSRQGQGSQQQSAHYPQLIYSYAEQGYSPKHIARILIDNHISTGRRGQSSDDEPSSSLPSSGGLSETASEYPSEMEESNPNMHYNPSVPVQRNPPLFQSEQQGYNHNRGPNIFSLEPGVGQRQHHDTRYHGQMAHFQHEGEDLSHLIQGINLNDSYTEGAQGQHSRKIR